MIKNNSVIVIILISLLLLSCGGGGDESSSNNGSGQTAATTITYDIDALGLPKFVNTNYIDLSKIYRISKFRSSAGHDFSDHFEDNRSMKHYFNPLVDQNGSPSFDWETIEIYAPVDGTVLWIWDEWGNGAGGYQLWIVPDGYPAFHIRIFHVTLETGIVEGTHITEGQLIGHHATDATWSDIGVSVWVPDPAGVSNYKERMVSIFNIMTDTCFAQYTAYPSITARDDLMISKSERDLYPGFHDYPEPNSWIDITP